MQEKALNEALTKHKSTVTEYTVAPNFIDTNKSGNHDWFIEFENLKISMILKKI